MTSTLTHEVIMPKDKYNRFWNLPDNELCPTCSQPDSIGDCNHARLSVRNVIDLGGTLSRPERRNLPPVAKTQSRVYGTKPTKDKHTIM